MEKKITVRKTVQHDGTWYFVKLDNELMNIFSESRLDAALEYANKLKYSIEVGNKEPETVYELTALEPCETCKGTKVKEVNICRDGIEIDMETPCPECCEIFEYK